MKLVPITIVALASLIASTSAIHQDFQHLPIHYERSKAHPASPAITILTPEAEANNRASLSFRADRPSSSTWSQRSSGNESSIQRRGDTGSRSSFWSVLFGTQKRRAVPSERQRRLTRARSLSRRSASSKRGKSKRAGSCKSNTTATASSMVPPSTVTASTPASSTSAVPSSTPTSSSGSGNKTSTQKTMAGYWPDWTMSTLPPSQIDFTKFDILNYAFAIPTQNFDLSLPTDPSGNTLKAFVTATKAGNTKAVLSIGGWGGSQYFSPAMRSNSTRATFISNIIKYYNKYQLDGIDLDWEYPNQVGNGNQYDPSDAANFQSFLQELRTALPNGALITAAVAFTPWSGSNGSPVASVARAASAIDYIMIMNYDVWGSSSNPGPNAPLADLCGNSTQPTANGAAGVKAWSSAGMPREKILLGIPAYGYINSSSKKTLRQRGLDLSSLEVFGTPTLEGDTVVSLANFGRHDHNKGTGLGPRPAKRASNASLQSMDGSFSSGQINFNSIVSQGALKVGSNGLFVGTGGFSKYWDDCSDTPYLSNGNTVVTYDDTSSIWDKGAFANAAGIGGLSMWSIDGDTSAWDLTDAAIAGMSAQASSS